MPMAFDLRCQNIHFDPKKGIEVRLNQIIMYGKQMDQLQALTIAMFHTRHTQCPETSQGHLKLKFDIDYYKICKQPM